jgi:hypothetical protein
VIYTDETSSVRQEKFNIQNFIQTLHTPVRSHDQGPWV